MIYRTLADVVLVIHLAFAVFAGIGGLLVLRWRKLAWVHVPCAVWGALIMFAGWICPLTPLENGLRRRGGQAGYEGGFIEHYVVSVLYPRGLTRGLQFGIGAGVIVVERRRLRTHDRSRAPAEARARGTGIRRGRLRYVTGE